MNPTTLSPSAAAVTATTAATATATASTPARARSSSTTSPAIRVVKWSLMSGALFWTAVYKLSESGLKVPDFVYVNF